MVSLPDKYHLSGADHFFCMLNSSEKQHEQDLMKIQMLLHFEDLESAKPLLDAITTSPFVFWANNITLEKGTLFSTSFWKFHDNGNQAIVDPIEVDDQKGIPVELLTQPIHLNKDIPLQFKLIRFASGKVAILIAWHHLLMDGRGAGMLIRHLSGEIPFDEKVFFKDITTKVSWFKRIRNLYEMKRAMAEYTKPIAVLPIISSEHTFQRIQHTFSVQETTTIQLTAQKMGVRFGLNLFYLAVCINRLQPFFSNSNLPLMIPVPYDGRKRGEIGPVCSNQIHFVFYKVKQEQCASLKQLVADLNQQMKAQLAADLPRKYNLLLDTMRYFPLALYRKMALKSGKHQSSSFLYSSAGESDRDLTNVSALAVKNIDLIPPFSVHPGITFSFSQVNQAVKMNITFNSAYLKEKDVMRIKSEIVSCLLGNEGD